MTREEAKEMLPIIKAFAEGKTIQLFTNGIWEGAENPSFEELSRYRIKPEPNYRPFKTQEECWNEMHKHPDFGWVKIKHNGIYSAISTMYRSSVEERVMVANVSYKLAQAFEIFTFTDDTPFGIKEE